MDLSCSIGNQVADDRLVHAPRNAIGADRLLVLVSGSPAVYVVRCGASMTVDDPAMLSF